MNTGLGDPECGIYRDGLLMKCWISVIRAFRVASLAALALCQGVAQTVPAATGSDYSFNVSTAQPWTDTGMDLQAGDVLNITASGSQKCDPQGMTGAASESARLPVGDALPGALIAKLQAQGSPVFIGSGKEIKADTTGHLFLGVNAGNKAPCQGSFVVKVHRQAQEASNRGDVLKQQLASAAEIFLAGQFGSDTATSATPSNAVSDSAATSASTASSALTVSNTPLDSSLRKSIDGLPRRVNDQFKNLGDMVNFVLVGSQQQVQSVLDASNWHVADTDD